MAYKRTISYFDFIEDEQKRGNAGFVKWEQYDECHILSVFVSVCSAISDREAKVLCDGNAIGRISIQGGRAEGTYLLTKEDKNWREGIGEIRIPVSDKCLLLAVFEEYPNAGGEPRIGQKEKAPEAEAAEEEFPVPVEEKQQEEEVPAITAEEKPQEEPVVEAEEEQSEEAAPVKEERPQASGNLWERLKESHEPFCPFENETECYRLFPKDIRSLHANYHALQNNQFLLHGYYNYRYLILFRKKDSENEYWLGVPGIYHEREKMAARMFGFEKFEGGKRDYRTGDLGYYLITVE